MITFTFALISLLLGYLIYGAIVDKVFAPKDHTSSMPCYIKRVDSLRLYLCRSCSRLYVWYDMRSQGWCFVA